MFKRITTLKSCGYLVLGLLITQACTKEEGGAEEESPISKQEVEQRIIGKWELNGSGQLASIEFTADGLYAVEGDLTALSGFNLASTAPREIKKIQQAAYAAGTVDHTGSHVGAYTVSANGDVVLDGVLTLKITKLADHTFEFELTDASGGSLLKGSATLGDTVAVTDRTQLLSRNWVFEGTDNPMFKELSLRFTPFGTAFLQMLVYVTDEAVGEDGQTEVSHSEEWVAWRMDWDWKTGEGDIVELYISSDGTLIVEEWPIRKLTQNELEIRVEFDERPFWLSLRSAD